MKKILIFTLLLFTCLSNAQQEYNIKNLQMNDDKSQYGLMYYQGNKVFFTAYTFNEYGKIRKDRMDQFIFGLYEGEISADHEINNVKRLKGADNFEFNSSSAAFSPDGRYIYITTNDIKRGEVYKTNDKTRNLRIERGEYVEGIGWTNFVTLSFCKNRYSYGHPALSPDGSTLYFVSNIPSAKGPTDIFRVKIEGDNKFSDPENLGELVNSTRRETFPFVSKDNVLYFASDRHGGNGGLDIYSCRLDENNEFGEAQLLPAPINSRQDDFTYILNDNLTEGYFSSNRRGGKGEDDIYFFVIKE